MARHRVYDTIVARVKEGKLKEPFTTNELFAICGKEIKEGTCKTFPRKHRKGNPGGNTVLFEMVSKGKFKIIRPFKYGV